MRTPEQTLITLARLDPDYPAFAAQLPDELKRAAKPLPNEMATDVLSLLRIERPELQNWLDRQADAQPPAKFLVDSPESAVALIGAIVFLLRTHIKIEGKHFLIEHKPIESDLLKKILDRFGDIFSRN
ncbi:MAG: hypothetical protein FWE19_03705 [Oscillospiraceae bacterium]|nr:hypothetical protein [Oscillospiraceae bacterium]